MAGTYGEPTDTLLRTARARQHAGAKLTGQDKLLLCLADGEWHGTGQLSLPWYMGGAGHRFGAAKFDLIEKGVRIEAREDEGSPKGERWYRYRLMREGQKQEAMF